MATAKPKINISSYMRGNVFEQGEFATLADLLENHGINMVESVIEITDAEGNEKRALAATKFNDGDTCIIMKAKNKSGR